MWPLLLLERCRAGKGGWRSSSWSWPNKTASSSSVKVDFSTVSNRVVEVVVGRLDMLDDKVKACVVLGKLPSNSQAAETRQSFMMMVDIVFGWLSFVMAPSDSILSEVLWR